MAIEAAIEKRNGRRWALASGAVLLFFIAGGAKLASDYKNAHSILDETGIPVSSVVLDRNDQLLRAFLTKDEKWRLPVDLEDIDPLYFQLLIAYEDRRFREHAGIDLKAFLRAAYQLVTEGRIVSGGSTLTMQVARLLSEKSTRSFSAKYHQALRALALESQLSKEEILALYALRAPFGGNLEGVRAASLIWFGKEPRRLTLAEAALLVALPQSPEARRPDRFSTNAKAARARVLAKAVEAGLLSTAEVDAANKETLPVHWRNMAQVAAHKAQQAISQDPSRSVHRLTLDYRLQSTLEQLAKQKVPKLGPKTSLAIVVADHQTGEILASIGSPDLLNRERQGHVDMSEAVRSPGSTLKPFIYGLAFEDRIAHPQSLIVDRPVDFDGYRPTNFDQGYQGAITVRAALQQSLNTPAVQLLDKLGTGRLLARLKRAGLNPSLPRTDGAGLAIGLGGVGFSLTDLVQLYAGLARLGKPVALFWQKEELLDPASAMARAVRRPFLSEEASWQVLDILSGLPQPRAAEAEAIAYKTGTSYGYRDAWSVGFDGRYVVGVWVGRPDGSPVPGQTGADVASPILFEAFQRIGNTRFGLPAKPQTVLDMQTAELPAPMRYARLSEKSGKGAGYGDFSIVFPPQGAVIELGSAFDPKDASPIILKLRGGKLPYQLLANGRPSANRNKSFSKQIRFVPEGKGVQALTVIDGEGKTASIRIDVR